MKNFLIATALCCGLVSVIALPSTLIADGEDAEQGELPYQIRLIYQTPTSNFTTCGGTLIEVNGRQIVVTSAYCLQSTANGPEYLSLVAGDLRTYQDSGKEQVRQATEYIIHEKYNIQTRVGNIALVKFDPPFEINDDVQPISLPIQGQTTTGDLLISGWGTPGGMDGYPSEHLQKVQHPVVNIDECMELYKDATYPFRPVPSMICTKSRTGRYVHCSQDVGGPAVSVEGGYLAGIISYPELCGDLEKPYPDVYTEVSYYIDWITAKVR